jgi:hypothetical protein
VDRVATTKSAGANDLLGEGDQDPRSEERGKGRERTSVMHNGPDTPVWGSSSDEGRRARSTHMSGPGACKENTHQRGRRARYEVWNLEIFSFVKFKIELYS